MKLIKKFQRWLIQTIFDLKPPTFSEINIQYDKGYLLRACAINKHGTSGASEIFAIADKGMCRIESKRRTLELYCKENTKFGNGWVWIGNIAQGKALYLREGDLKEKIKGQKLAFFIDIKRKEPE